MKRQPVHQYFHNIVNSLITIPLGMSVTIKYFFTKPVTLQYPDEKPDVPDGFRGIHEYDVDRCIICNMCARECPISCINLEQEGKGKEKRLLKFEIDYSKCLFCNLCCEVCPKDCLIMGKKYDLASRTREGCVVSFFNIEKNKSNHNKASEGSG
jgi:NADH-quinone oxidoreductase chain I